MADPKLTPNPEQRRVAAGQFARANQVIASSNFDYAIQLLLTCCRLDPANLVYRQTLRATARAKYKNNMHGSRLALAKTWSARAGLKAALGGRDHLKVLEYGERILAYNPWDAGVQLDMARAAEALGLLDQAVWLLEHARLKDADDLKVNRALARLYERRGDFGRAIALWERICQADPGDPEAQDKAKDLAASDVIARGRYEEAAAQAAEKEPGGTAPPTPAFRPTGPAATPAARADQEAAAVRVRLEQDPTNPNGYLQIAGIYRRAGQLDKARQALQEGLGPTGNHFELASALADMEIEPFRRNLDSVDRKLAARPQDLELQGIRGRLLKEINTRELDLYRLKSDRYPADRNFRYELGVRLLRADQADEAIRELQAVRNDTRNGWRASYYLGFCFKGRNNWRLAQRNFEEALAHLPSGEEASRKELLFELARGHAEAGELDRALEYGFELANLDFGFHEIGRLLDDWQARQRQARLSGATPLSPGGSGGRT